MAIRVSDNKVLVLGDYRQALTITRSLARAGYHVIAGSDGNRSVIDYSRYNSEMWHHPNIETEESDFVAALIEFLEKNNDSPLIFPVGDTQISCIARNFGRLRTSVALVMPNPVTALSCQNKSRVYELNQGLGIPQPNFQKAFNYSNLRSVVERIGYPCVVKPNDSFAPFFGEKAIIVRSCKQMSTTIPHWPDGHEYLLVQEYAQGDRHTCNFVAVGGEILAYFEYKILRTDRGDGTGYMVEGVSVAPTLKLRGYSQSLVRELNYSGAGSTQFLVDDTLDCVNFLEINPRLGASCALPYYCGCDLPKMAVEVAECMMGARTDPPMYNADYPDGKRMVWLMGDIHSMIRDSRAGRLNAAALFSRVLGMLAALLRADFHATWWWKDPLPTVVIYGRLVNSALKKMRRRIFSK
jgi:predicted ATP-grasp superfamily ATP-dependent carboligase